MGMHIWEYKKCSGLNKMCQVAYSCKFHVSHLPFSEVYKSKEHSFNVSSLFVAAPIGHGS